jgi:dolichol-phosphate mannosyltransferase
MIKSSTVNELSISIIMPALNEGNNIKDAIDTTLAGIKKYNIDGEVIVVNDGSTDKTKAIVEEIMTHSNNVKLIDHNSPKGIGYSFFDGVKHSDKEVVVMFPGDNESNPDDALSFFKLMSNVDIIVPFIHNVEVRDIKRRFISAIYRFIINLSFGIGLTYTNGTVFYRRCILENLELKSAGFFYQAELLIRLIRKGYLYAEVPNFLSVRGGGASKATTLKSLIKVFKDYIKLAIDIHIKRIEGKKNFKKLHPRSITYKKINDLYK